METMKAVRGRKPIADKKQNITIYLPKSIIEKLGGKENLKSFLHQTIKHETSKS